MINTTSEQQMEDFIRQVFEQNYEELRVESSHALAPSVKDAALDQVVYYWRKLNDIARSVTDTEVRLSLPNQQTPNGREYAIEGIVDIVQEKDCTVMYDIKTHNADFVRDNIEAYEQQLNVYAHIWQNLRGQPLNSTAIIATDIPQELDESKSEDEINEILKQWEPVVPIRFDLKKVEETIDRFSKVVDNIEDGYFAPPPMQRLNEFVSSTKLRVRFGTQVCRNCDARFSCKAYREYAWRGGRTTAERVMAQYFAEALPDDEQEVWRTGNLDVLPAATDLRPDFTSR